ncbi:hypothetical protein QOZ80_6AG0511430 [Eleusine coracana subsp. coracana]|nr:hypothetical protein QOZ80_6AG0511430 [Eleusine coracana subsp. coracana]
MLLRRAGGLSAAISSHLRRGLSTAAASRPEWAMISVRAPLVRSPAPSPSLQLLEPPSASRLFVPINFVDPRPGPNAHGDAARRFHGGFVHAASCDGLLLLDFMDIRDMDLLAGAHAYAQAAHFHTEFGPDGPDILRFLCNPVSGEMFRLPEAGSTKKVLALHSHGLLTRSARGHGPPDRYAIAEMNVDSYGEALVFTMRRFLSQTGKWEKLVCSWFPRGLQLDRGFKADHEVLAFAGRLCWVDVSWGALSLDPFGDRPDFRFVELPRGSVTNRREAPRHLSRYRRMGVSEGKLRYAEVSWEEPFVLSSFVLDNDNGCWTLEHRMALSRLCVSGVRPRQEDTPRIAVIDPLDASVMHITIGNIAFAVDMDKEKVLGCSTLPIDEGDDDSMEGIWYFQPCLLPPWLGSSPIPSAGTLSSSNANVKINTLSDILVRVDRSKKN